MIDHIVGTPSPSWKRTQVSLLHPVHHPFFIRPPRFFLLSSFGYGELHGAMHGGLAFFGYELSTGDLVYCMARIHGPSGSYPFSDDFTPWQIIVSTLTAVYAMRNADKLIGLGGEFLISDSEASRTHNFPL